MKEKECFEKLMLYARTDIQYQSCLEKVQQLEPA